jgi:hexosaminidase
MGRSVISLQIGVSYLGFAVGAAYAWDYQANQNLDIPRALSLHAFQDRSLSFGQAAYDLGNVYQSAGVIPGNSSALFNILQMRFPEIRKYADHFDPKILSHVLEVIDQAIKPLAMANSTAPEADLLFREFENTARMLRHACHRGKQAFGIGDQSLAELDLDLREIMIEYQDLWLRRSRPGGLVDSLARFENSRQDYLEP